MYEDRPDRLPKYEAQPSVICRWTLLALLALVVLYALFVACGAARAEENPEIPLESVTSTWTSYSAGLGIAFERIEAAGLYDGKSVCRWEAIHEYKGIARQGKTWTLFTSLSE